MQCNENPYIRSFFSFAVWNSLLCSYFIYIASLLAKQTSSHQARYDMRKIINYTNKKERERGEKKVLCVHHQTQPRR